MTPETKLLILLGAVVLITSWIACHDDPRCWRWIRRRWHQRRAWRDLEAMRHAERSVDERSKRVWP